MLTRSTLGGTPSNYSADVYSRAQKCASNGDFWHDMAASFNRDCFAFSPAGWEEIAAFKTPDAPPPVKPPADLVKPPASGEAAEQTINEILINQMRAWQAQNQTFFNTQPSVGAPDDPPDNSTLYAVAAAAAVLAAILLFRR